MIVLTVTIIGQALGGLIAVIFSVTAAPFLFCKLLDAIDSIVCK